MSRHQQAFLLGPSQTCYLDVDALNKRGLFHGSVHSVAISPLADLKRETDRMPRAAEGEPEAIQSSVTIERLSLIA